MRSASTKAKTRAGRKDAAIKKRAVTTARGLVKNAPKAAADSDEDIRTLKRALVEAHQRERATADVLKVISRSTFDLQTVLDALVESAAKLCEAEAAAIARQIDSVYKPVATYGQAGDDKAFSARTTIQPTRGSALGRAVIDGRAIHIADVLADPEYDSWENQRSLGFRTILAVPILRQQVSVGVIILIRKAVRPFTDEQIELVTTFADQAVIAIENARLFYEAQARTKELSESLEQQTATSEVLRVISNSPGELAPVFKKMLEEATRVCNAKFGSLLLQDGGVFQSVAQHNVPPAFAELRRRDPTIQRSPDSPVSRVERTKQVVHVADVREEPVYIRGGRSMVELADVGGVRTLLLVPMLKDDELIGVFNIYRQEVQPFSNKQIELVQNFARQAVIAIENTRLLKELRQRTSDLTEALEQQTAMSEVLQVVSSSPGELKPVFEAMLESATRICGAKFGVLWQREGDGLRTVALHGAPPEYVAERRRTPVIHPRPETTLGRAAALKQVVQIADLRDEIQPTESASGATGAQLAVLAGARTLITVPMLKEDELVGVIGIFRQEVRSFTHKQIELVSNFAKQAVIAIENTRLLNELRQRTEDLSEALEQQTATSEVLQVISSSQGELNPVFQAMLENATRICEATFGSMLFYDDDTFRRVAMHNAPSPFAKFNDTLPLIRTQGNPTLTRLVETKQPTQVADLAADSPDEPIAKYAGARTLLVVPMLKGSELIGAIGIYRQEVLLFTEKQIELVQNFAKQAVIAIENARLLNELRQRTKELARSVDELRALGDVSQAVNSTLDLATVLSTIVARAVQLSDTDAGTIYEFDKQNELRLRSNYGMSEELINDLGNQHLGLNEPIIEEAVSSIEPAQTEDILTVPLTPARDILLRAGYRAVLIVPLLGRDHVIGVLAVRRKAPGAFPQSTVDLLKTFAAQSVLAIQNAHLFTEIEQKSHQLEIASQHKSQFLANMSHELRTPLNAILGYTELILDNIYGDTPDKMREVLERLQANGKHLLGLINDVLDLSKIEAGQLTLDLSDYSLKEVVHTVFTAVESLATGKKLALTTVVALNLPVGHGDERRLAQVLLNLVGNAIKFTDKGEVAIEATTSDGSFTVAVRDTGPGISPSDQSKIFEEFQQADNSATKRKGGTGLGLSIAKRIIGMHGGRIWVESDVGKGSTFAFTIPVKVERQVSEP
jgi:GAF domain-containing protein/anti-sigma regulatory factor (Ser/Thr protein kinase)